MNFVQFHIGDWDSSTRLLSPLEKGIYIDLIFLYYSLERPLMRSECDRIARAYTDEERSALEYVLERFFMADGDKYRHQRCDKEIGATRSKSHKAAASAKARWDRQKANEAKKAGGASQVPKGCDTDANAIRTHDQTQCGRNADGMLTDNRKPITDKYKSVSDETLSSANANASESEKVEPADTSAQTTAKRNPPLPYQQVIDLYNEKCTPALAAGRMTDKRREEIRCRWKDLQQITGAKTEEETLAEFGKFFERVARSDFLTGRTGAFKADLPWLLGREKFEATLNGRYDNRQGAAIANNGPRGTQVLPPHKNPAQRFDAAYYERAKNPDGSFNWGV